MTCRTCGKATWAGCGQHVEQALRGVPVRDDHPRAGFGQAETPLRIKDNPIDRRPLENGSELFAVSGRVTNPSGSSQRVPDIRAELRDAHGKLVYGWTIAPQQRTLAPGAFVDFNSAKLDVPAASKRLELSFAGQTGG